MFDTVKFGIPIGLSLAEISNVQWNQVNEKTKGNEKTKVIYYDYHDTSFVGSPYIKYTHLENDPTNGWLKVTVSLPKLMYGTNVHEINENDVPYLLRLIIIYLSKLFKRHPTTIPTVDFWVTEKLHVSKNFHTGSKVQNYLQSIRNVPLPQHKIHTYCEKGSDRLQTVEWIARTRKEKFYDKLAEVKDNKNHHENYCDVIQEAKGILRYEIELSDNEIRNISPFKKPLELLTTEVAIKVLKKGLKRLGLDAGVNYSSINDVLDEIDETNTPTITKNSLKAFAISLVIKGDAYVRDNYARSTYKKNLKLLLNILKVDKLIFSDKYLEPLTSHSFSFEKRIFRFC